MEGGCFGMANSLTQDKKIKIYEFRKTGSLKITQDTYLITFDEIEDLCYEPGQFCMVKGAEESLTKKPFTLGMLERYPTLSVKAVGLSSRKIIETKIGETLSVLAPLGNAFTPPNKNGIVLVAASCFAEGIFISKRFGTPIIVSSRIPFEKEFTDFFGQNIRDDISKLVVGDSEFITTLEILDKLNIDWIFVSGSKGMERAVKERIKTKIVFFSLNEYMGCGIGACKSCAVETIEGIKHICTDGPVFRSDELCII